MQVVALFASVLTIVVGAVVGARMLLLARRTGQRPELLLGASLFAYAAVGQPLLIASRPLGEAFGFEARLAVVTLALASQVVSLVGLYLFTWTVFRRDRRWAAVLVWAGGAVALAACLLIVPTIPRTPGQYAPATRAGLALLAADFCASMAWTAWESLRYHARMRRRLAVGLADAVVVNRFLLWGVGCGTVACVPMAMIASVAAGLDLVVHPVPLLLMSVGGFVISVCWTLTFFPPRAYTRWVTARA
ncbi:MAG: hypothetical protein ACQGVC_07320 [Myxococcota bacterium]